MGNEPALQVLKISKVAGHFHHPLYSPSIPNGSIWDVNMCMVEYEQGWGGVVWWVGFKWS